MIEPTPVTYRMIGKGDSDAIVRCNCVFDEGHEATCDIVAANRILVPSNYREPSPPVSPPAQGEG